jgi:hypothetical protein
MSQLTIRCDPQLDEKIRELATREGISLNQAAIRLLRRGAGIDEPQAQIDVVGSSLDDLIGTWSDAEAEQMHSAEQAVEAIDEDLWK